MRKVFINKWFFLAVFLTISLSAFSFAVYKKAQTTCSASGDCCQHTPAEPTQRADMLWDVISRQFTNFISIQYTNLFLCCNIYFPASYYWYVRLFMTEKEYNECVNLYADNVYQFIVKDLRH